MNPPLKLTEQEKGSTSTSFGSSYKYQGIEPNLNIILTHVLNSCNKNKSSAHPITCEFTSAETVALNIYSIEIK